MPSLAPTKTYGARASLHKNPAARQFLTLMEKKKSNLCVSVDVTTKAEFLKVVEAVGEECCLIKTHIDIISDFDQDLVDQLTALSKKLDFMIFEDRKFADIGNTVTLQYSAGVHKISSWSHMTNAHPVPGDGVVTGLQSIGLPLGRGMMLLAEMSSAGNLAKGLYTQQAVEMATRHPEFVFGFIGMRRVEDSFDSPEAQEQDWVIMTPGVSLQDNGDAMGQQYRSPDQVVLESGCDVIIVGRGVYGGGRDSAAMKEEAKKYKAAGWGAYEKRISKA